MMLAHLLGILAGMLAALSAPMLGICLWRLRDRWPDRVELGPRWIGLIALSSISAGLLLQAAYAWWLSQFFFAAVSAWPYPVSVGYRVLLITGQLLTIHSLTMGHPKCRHCWRWCAGLALVASIIADAAV